MKHRWPVLRAGVSLLLAVGACQSPRSNASGPPKVEVDQICGTTWRLARLRGTDVPDDARITLELSGNGKVAGSTGVNSYRGAWKSDAPGTIRFAAFAVTRRAGPSDAMRREAELLAAIERVEGYRMDDADWLILLDDSEARLVWRR